MSIYLINIMYKMQFILFYSVFRFGPFSHQRIPYNASMGNINITTNKTQINTLTEKTILKNQYEILSVLGTGGFGTTYLAKELATGKEVAIKVSELQNGFIQEGKIIHRLKGIPHIIHYIDSFQENQLYCLVTSRICGETLSSYVKSQGGTLPSDEVLFLFHDFLYDLARIHDLGFLHRDISPGNLMITDEGDLILIDFGSASSYKKTDYNDSTTENPLIFAHKGLEAPEYNTPSLQGPWTDIYTLAATMVYLMSGQGIQPPEERTAYDQLPSLLTKLNLSRKEQDTLAKALNLNIRFRYDNVLSFLSDLYNEPLDLEPATESRLVSFQAFSTIGTRAKNQDNFVVDTLHRFEGEDCSYSGTILCDSKRLHLVAVCDGVGGACYGDIASDAAITSLLHFLETRQDSHHLPERLLHDLLNHLNSKLVKLGKQRGKMATTISILLWTDNRYYAANIGDSPIFLLRQKRLTRISASHTLANKKLAENKPVTVSDFNTLTRYLGKENATGSSMASLNYGKLEYGDTFLLCSDGITKILNEQQLKKQLGKPADRAIASIKKSISKKTDTDNCTAILVSF